MTKTNCELVVAFDPSTTSGKAKKARELGKPVLSAADFLEKLLDTTDGRRLIRLMPRRRVKTLPQ